MAGRPRRWQEHHHVDSPRPVFDNQSIRIKSASYPTRVWRYHRAWEVSVPGLLGMGVIGIDGGEIIPVVCLFIFIFIFLCLCLSFSVAPAAASEAFLFLSFSMF